MSTVTSSAQAAANTDEQANGAEFHLVTIDEVRRDPEVLAFLHRANESLRALGK